MDKLITRQKNLLAKISNLDISPTMYRNAVEKYKAIASFLDSCGIKADIYPQGSFALGTVVRPYRNNGNAAYDLDIICQVLGKKEDYTPSSLRNAIQEALESSEVYKQRLTVYDKCFTISYAEEGGAGFSIDIVPAVDEDIIVKVDLKAKTCFGNLIDTAIAIPKYTEGKAYRWFTNNPKGLAVWFSGINARFIKINRIQRRQAILNEYANEIGSIEKIPEYYERSPLQRVIQILKRHRDIYYSRIKDGTELKPISSILNVLTAQNATLIPNDIYHENAFANESEYIFELLKFVITALNHSEKQLTMRADDFKSVYASVAVCFKDDNGWYLANPANPKDNLMDRWNEDSRIARKFFDWIQKLEKDFINGNASISDADYDILLENSFGFTSQAKQHKADAPAPILYTPKPWGGL